MNTTIPTRSADIPGSAEALYLVPFPAARTGPLYNAFSYPTKISPEAIALFIATHTEPGDNVLDVFAGSGTTGVAAKLCDSPTPKMIELADEFGLNPRWGPRDAVLYDVGVLGSFVSRVMCNPPDPQRFREAAALLLKRAERSMGWLYETVDPDGVAATIRHTIWSEVLECPTCSSTTTFWDAAVGRDPLRIERVHCCGGCGDSNLIAEYGRKVEEVFDPLIDQSIVRRVRVPVYVYGRTGKRTWGRLANSTDAELAERIESAGPPAEPPIFPVDWGDLHRSGYHTGISYLHHFYTPRNFQAICTLWSLVSEFDQDLQDALRFLILSFNSSHSTLMTRIVVKSGQSDFSVTGAQSGVLYVSALPVEKNVFDGVRRKVETISSAFQLVYESESTVRVINASSSDLDLADESVNYVFTDPPFGDFIPYAEINQLNELWLGVVTDRNLEAIVSVSAGRDHVEYGEMMAEVFDEVSRVLSPDGCATVVFHSAKASIWQALAAAYSNAGLRVRATSVLDKTQSSFKQVVGDTVVRGDPLILLEKGDQGGDRRELGDIVLEVIAGAGLSEDPAERTRERVYSRFVAQCLLEDIEITLSAGDFYALPEVEGLAFV